MRRAKIVCTLGPACEAAETVLALVENGMDVARLNFSHGTHEDHARVIENIRAASRKLIRPVAILQDLQGPKIRTGPLKAGRAGVVVQPGARIVITTEGEVPGDETLVSTTYAHLAEDVHRGDRLLVDDGLLEFRVLDTDGVRVTAEVVEGGVLKEHKGINLPGVKLRVEALSDKDRADLRFGVEHGVDYVALSFVRTADDVREARRAVESLGRVLPIVAKIEKPEALETLDDIVEAADGLMVARGDLGVEVPPEQVPTLQKAIVRKGNQAGKPVIIATQMLDSMIEHPRPTRAEASDVANAVWDGADAVMLSGETASGRYPLLAVQIMDRIVREAEQNLFLSRPRPVDPPAPPIAFNDVVASAAVRAALDCDARCIACFTVGGTTARLLSRYRPHVPIVAFSPDQKMRRRMSLYWGVTPRIMEPVRDPDSMAQLVSERLLQDELAQPGDRVVLVYGSPLGEPGHTNSIRLHQIPTEPPRGRRYRVPI
ncbi:MAG TPA: pyruvate kinase [Anaeromyxobacteraceae bacterium]|nr:pyruvate kinase [Anaeromyxobacteraceae bacterium]